MKTATLIVLAACPVHLLLAIATDLSPDEAYYLCAARRPVFSPLVDHPPLLPWLLRASDLLSALPVELRVRVWPIALSLALGAACVWMARARGADERGARMAAWLGAWSLLPMAGGFVATPDAPALVACAAALLWAGSAGARVAGSSRAREAISSLVAGCGALAKVIVLPVVGLAALGAQGRSVRSRLLYALPIVLAAPLLLPSLRFQLRHAFVDAGPGGVWTPLGALGALGAAVAAQALLWSPWPLALGLRRLAQQTPSPLSDRLVVLGVTALIVVSALARGVPPEPNWWAPAALPVIVAAACASMELARPRRVAMLATVLAPTAIALTHVVHPWIPLPRETDPTARLHGWSSDQAPAGAPGVGAYGAAAERCVYRGECDRIDSYFQCMDRDIGSGCSALVEH